MWNEKKKIVDAVIFFTQPFYDETYNNPISDRKIEKARQKRNMRHKNKNY